MSKPGDENNDRYSLSEIQKLIKQSLEDKLQAFYWVSAEISELKINHSGHCYLELVEKNKQEDIRSRARAIIWSAKARLLLPYFENIAGQPLSEDIKVMLRVKIDYHEIYGLSLVINDIDPAYTVGEIAVKRKQIIKRLESEGVIDLNRELFMPLLPASIAVISSEQAAGYEDFIDELLRNEHGYSYKTKLFSAVMQGKETEASVIKAINKIFERISDFDIVVIVRGGGSQSDLSWFDNYNIAYLITQMPIPVLTGIGHEKDLSVTDIVAHRSFKTPTAVADYIINHSLKTEEYLSAMRESIISLSRELVKTKRLAINRISIAISPLVRSVLKQKHSQLNRSGLRLSGNARSYLSDNRSGLETIKTNIKKRSSEFILNRNRHINDLNNRIIPGCSRFTKQKHSILDNLSRSINYLSPSSVLKRGYSITLFNDKAVKSRDELTAGSRIETILNKGRIDSEVFDLKKPDK
ncbi:MAG: exodeoxyribonuclease VII large subunit [Bacteroidales bacterium]|nr:exodeoxyribonuclease VII large subunit [Bacteroidales bacterium]